MYVVLLVSFLVIGYLLGKLETFQKGPSAQENSAQLGTQTAPAQQQPQQPSAPDPKEVLKKLDKGHFPALGNENAKVTIIEFSDLECPFCARFYKDALPQLTKEYIDTGKVKLYYRHFPLSFHPKAKPLAHATECANEQGKFWEMHDKIFTENDAGNLASATDATYEEWAAAVGVDTAKFKTCFTNKTYEENITKDNTAGTDVGVSGTPTFYINGRQLVGAQPFESFKTVIEEELKK